jgi:putative transposase
MPRPNLIRSEHHPYHITARCNNQEFFPLPLSEVWQIMLRELKNIHDQHKIAIHAFVLMGNHFHLLCHTPQGNLDQAMHVFMRSTSMSITRKAGGINHLWGGRYKWSLIDSQTHYYHVYRYIFQNPLRAGLVGKVQDYPFSSLNLDMPFPLHSHIPLGFAGKEGENLWLNDRYESEEEAIIRTGLKKGQFDVNRRKVGRLMRI